MRRARVLVGCEFSGIVRSAFYALGFDAWSCDLLESEDGGPHLQCDVLSILNEGWSLAIFHPPCTFLTNAGVRWLYKNGKGTERDLERWGQMEAAGYFFNKLLHAPIDRICIENPIMHSYGRSIVETPPAQTIQPWQFGCAETKATQLYLKNLPALQPTDIVKPDLVKHPPGRGNGFEPRVHHASPRPDRWKERSRTLPGVAAAMATQWEPLL